MMASVSLLFLIIFCLLCHAIRSENLRNPTPYQRNIFCSSTTLAGNPDSDFQTPDFQTPYSLKNKLENLFDDAASEKNGYYYSWFSWNSTTEPKVYASFLCRGDITLRWCYSCIYYAAWELNYNCHNPFSREAYIFEDKCTIRYSDNKAVLSYRLEPHLYKSNPKSFKKQKHLTKLHDFIDTTIGGELASKAARDKPSGKKFATKEVKFSSFQTLYSLVQCTPDLTLDECIKCIHSSVSLLANTNAKGANVYRPSCYMRYELYLFYQINDPKVLQLVLKIECGVLIATVLVLAQFVLGCIRRRIHNTWQGVCFQLLYTLITIGIPYLIGLMRSVDLSIKLFPIWSFFLIFAYGGSDTMTAYNVSDNDNSLGYYFRMMPLLFGATYMIGPSFFLETAVASFTEIETYLVPLVVVYILALWNLRETRVAFTCASKTNGLSKLAARIENYMCNDLEEAPIARYSFLVNANDDLNHAITTEQVLQCEGKLLNLTEASVGGCSGRLKDICLSRAFFNILLIRFAGCSLQDSLREKLQRFVQEKLLLLEGDARQQQERVFHMIEVELGFAFDFFYTKFFFLSKQRFGYNFIRLAGIVVCLWFALYELDPKTSEQVIQVRGHNLEVGVTRAVIILLAILEAVQLYMRIFSDWTLVKLLCQYVEHVPAKKSLTILEKRILFISKVKDFLSRTRGLSCMLKPWKRKLGQYSLLQRYDHVPKRNYLSCLIGDFVKLPRKGQKESPPIALSTDVKQAIFSLLANHGLTLSFGKTSLTRNDLSELAGLCDLESDAHVILVWHIATCVCEHSAERSDGDDEHFNVATQLSKYCAYLVIFAPELLSGVPYKTLITFDETIKYARDNFKGSDMENICRKMEGKIEDDTVFGKAARLANHLKTHVLIDPNRGWRVLAEFWVELLLFLAPTENATVHAERLGKGGEFITLLWTLLTNAGIVSRDCFQPPTIGHVVSPV